jgi:hypothetical protein
MGALVTPGYGWNRFLSFNRNGTYSLWERDSLGDSLLCSGQYTVHPPGDSPRRIDPPWVELDKWWYSFATRQQIFFEGNDTLKTYPGGGGMTVFDALTDLYLRDSTAYTVTTRVPSHSPAAHHRHEPVVKRLHWVPSETPTKSDTARIIPGTSPSPPPR